jgi:predicted house-cleaning noncanonical NTP pyrophosphatase (MazG superfamily)
MLENKKQAITENVENTDYAVALWSKFREECIELEEAIEEGAPREEIVDEIADVITVLEALSRNVFKANIATIIEEKLNESGGFEQGVILKGFEWIA